MVLIIQERLDGGKRDFRGQPQRLEQALPDGVITAKTRVVIKQAERGEHQAHQLLVHGGHPGRVIHLLNELIGRHGAQRFHAHMRVVGIHLHPHDALTAHILLLKPDHGLLTRLGREVAVTQQVLLLVGLRDGVVPGGRVDGLRGHVGDAGEM